MKQTTFALKGTICYSQSQNQIGVYPDSYLVCENGLCAGIFSELPEAYHGIPVRDTEDSLIIPGLTDQIGRAHV